MQKLQKSTIEYWIAESGEIWLWTLEFDGKLLWRYNDDLQRIFFLQNQACQSIRPNYIRSMPFESFFKHNVFFSFCVSVYTFYACCGCGVQCCTCVCNLVSPRSQSACPGRLSAMEWAPSTPVLGSTDVDEGMSYSPDNMMVVGWTSPLPNRRVFGMIEVGIDVITCNLSSVVAHKCASSHFSHPIANQKWAEPFISLYELKSIREKCEFPMMTILSSKCMSLLISDEGIEN